MRKILVGFLLVFGISSYGQSVAGTTGLIHIPSARMLEDGQLVLGAGYIPKGIYFRTYGPLKYTLKDNPGLTTYLTYQILPFVELMFRYSHELGVKVNTNTLYFPDRMFSARIRVLKESNFKPALVFGFHDMTKFFEVQSGRPNFSSSYAVLSKKIRTTSFEIDSSLGFAFDFFKLKAMDYKGFFYGIEIKHLDFNFVSFNFENNSKNFNTGIKFSPHKKTNFMIGLWSLNKPTFSFNYMF